MIQVNRIYLIFNRLVTKKFLVDTSDVIYENQTKIERRKWYFACLSYVDAVTFKLTSCTDMEY